MKKDVMILAGAGQIGMAIARRMGYGKKIIVGDKKAENARMAAETMNGAGFDALPVEMDLSSRPSVLSMIAEAQKHGETPCWSTLPVCLQARPLWRPF